MESCSSSVYEYDLDENELDSFEFSIPPPEGSPPSLDSVLRELTDDEDNIDKKSNYKTPSTTSSTSAKNGTNVENSLLHHVVLQGITSQLFSANERIDAGLPTTLAASAAGIVCVGTAHGIVLTFDSAQALRWCSRKPDYGAVSALCLNTDATRLLAGHERGHIDMFDAQSGDSLRSMPDAHAPHTAVLHLRFADWPNLAFCADSAGCVFSLAFGRRLGIRSWESKCLFSGARGEVCALEPLVNCDTELRPHVLLAMATLTKIIVVSVRPRLRIIFTHLLTGSTAYLPLIAWQPLGPILAFARGMELALYRLGTNAGAIRALQLRKKVVSKPLRAIHFLSFRVLSCLDADEHMHILDARVFHTRETIDLSSVGLIYASAHFKALATGGCVSLALARAGEYACYGSLSACGRRLLVLGVRGLHAISVRTASERLKYLRDAGRWAEVLKLASVSGSRDFTLQLIREYLLHDLTQDGLAAAINCCIILNDENLLCTEIWEKTLENPQYESWFFTILEAHITAGQITNLAPSVAQALVAFHEKNNTLEQLESLLPSLNVACLDLHQLLSACCKHGLYTITLWLNATALHDFTGPLTELLPILEEGKSRQLGNVLLVYISCCLAGRAYPRGEIPKVIGIRAKSVVLRYLLAKPCSLLKALLRHDPFACVNVFELAFVEPDFTGEIGQLRRQNVIKQLLELVEGNDQRNAVLGLICRGFVAGTLEKNDQMLQAVVDWLKVDTSSEQNGEQTSEKISSGGEPSEPKKFSSNSIKEQLWLDMLTANILSHLSNEELLEMVNKTKCFRVKELILERTQDYSEIVQCYLSDEHRKKDIFNYMRKHSQSPHREIRTQLLDRFDDLLQIDKTSTINIVVELFPELIAPICERIATYQPEVLTELLWTAVRSPGNKTSFSLNLASFAQEAGDYELAARLLESGGDLAGALSLLLSGDAAPQAAALCARAPEPARLLGTVSDPKLLSRLLKATLSDCAYETLLYETTCKLLSLDLHNSLCKELARSKRGRLVPPGTVGCLTHKSLDCCTNTNSRPPPNPQSSSTEHLADLSIF